MVAPLVLGVGTHDMHTQCVLMLLLLVAIWGGHSGPSLHAVSLPAF